MLCRDVSVNPCRNVARNPAGFLPDCLKPPGFWKKKEIKWNLKIYVYLRNHFCKSNEALQCVHWLADAATNTPGVCWHQDVHEGCSNCLMPKPSPFPFLTGFLEGDKEGNWNFPVHLPQFFHLLRVCCYSFFLKKLLFCIVCRWVTSFIFCTKPYLLHSAVLQWTVPSHSSSL